MRLRLWLRDDDAGPLLPGLVATIRLFRPLPLAFAVVPERLEPATVEAIRRYPEAVVLQHGIRHTNHARSGEKKIELGGAADARALRDGLLAGMERLRRAFPEQFLPVLVPPWNRIAPEIEHMLPGLGYVAISTFRGRQAAPIPGLLRIDTDLDVIDWRKRRLRSPKQLDLAVDHLASGTTGETLGILTHHPITDAPVLSVLRAWLQSLWRRYEVEWVDLRTLLREADR